MSNKLQFYEVDESYINYLRKFDNKVAATKEEDRKQTRKYIGILFTINEIDYLAPLSSFKVNKHTRMKDSIDFIKISNYAVINLNNMIPVSHDVITAVQFDLVEDYSYKNLLENEYKIIKSKKDKIFKNVNILYKQVTEYNKPISLRCCKFKLLELKCKEYNSIKPKEIEKLDIKV